MAPAVCTCSLRTLDSLSELILVSLVAISLILAYFSYRFVERPFKDRDRISRQKIAVFRQSGIFIFSGLGLAISKAESDRIGLDSYGKLGLLLRGPMAANVS